MIGVLRDGNAHGERRTVAATGNDGGRRRRRDHGAIARAAVLLPDVVFDVIRRLHRRDPLGGFGLAREFGQCAAARRARTLVRGQLMPDLHNRQGGLRARPVARLWTSRRIGRRVRQAALQNGRARLLELLLDAERELFHGGQAAQAGELRRQLEIFCNEALILSVEQETNLAERLEIVFVAQPDHVPCI